ncbi:MAG: hypothetical protein RLO52_47725 [Sandaracinaceae bacterium]|nr:MAG: hypothetical protein EVA89_07360 [Sandaracinaceae bacterium]
MTSGTWLLLSWILVGAATLVVHALVLWQVLWAEKPAGKWRWLALIPPAAPVIGWLGGRRVAPILWGVLALTYLVLRLV